ncbi:MAG TPA: lysophospholipid acyltransferase family protein [Gallionellaceae bacterium]|nr:lysophospholipid acyltransferase family protein [Gallionellaceae bacterium]
MEQSEAQHQASGIPRLHHPTRVSRMRFLRKAIRLGLHIIGGLGLAVVYPLFGATAQHAILRWWSKAVLAILGVRLDAQGARPGMLEGGVLLVANHVSWLDVFAVNAVRPSCFVAKSEVRDWPAIGTLCKRAQTIFISRARRGDAAEASRRMAARIASGECVAVFPEGTSTDGTDVRPFHSPLFQSAIEAARPVIPVAIHYRDGAGHPAREAAFIGEMTFVQSLVNILSCESLHVSLLFLRPIDCTGKNRRGVAAEAHAAVSPAVRELNRGGWPWLRVSRGASCAARHAAAGSRPGVAPVTKPAALKTEE